MLKAGQNLPGLLAVNVHTAPHCVPLPPVVISRRWGWWGSKGDAQSSPPTLPPAPEDPALQGLIYLFYRPPIAALETSTGRGGGVAS